LKKLSKHSPSDLRSKTDNSTPVSSDRGSSVDRGLTPNQHQLLQEAETFYTSHDFAGLKDPEAERARLLKDIETARQEDDVLLFRSVIDRHQSDQRWLRLQADLT
jgi:hypothetical protein